MGERGVSKALTLSAASIVPPPSVDAESWVIVGLFTGA
jgi:hypothetical protein